MRAIVGTAHEHDRFVSGHVTQGKYIRPLIEAGGKAALGNDYGGGPCASQTGGGFHTKTTIIVL
jgi:hypothetical protein